jgi:hypothetical protein
MPVTDKLSLDEDEYVFASVPKGTVGVVDMCVGVYD